MIAEGTQDFKKSGPYIAMSEADPTSIQRITPWRNGHQKSIGISAGLLIGIFK
jgi:hypothetical protein